MPVSSTLRLRRFAAGAGIQKGERRRHDCQEFDMHYVGDSGRDLTTLVTGRGMATHPPKLRGGGNYEKTVAEGDSSDSAFHGCGVLVGKLEAAAGQFLGLNREDRVKVASGNADLIVIHASCGLDQI